MTTPDTEWKLPKADMLADDIYGHQKEWYERTKVEAILTAHTAYWKQHEQDMYESLEKEYQLQVKHAQEERDTYWKERVLEWANNNNTFCEWYEHGHQVIEYDELIKFITKDNLK